MTEGLLRVPTPREAEDRLTLAVLRPIANRLGIPTGGPKAQLLERILVIDEGPLVSFIAREQLLICSEKAKRVVSETRERSVLARREARQAIRTALVNGDADVACYTYLRYLREWTPHRERSVDDALLDRVRHLLRARPDSLRALDGSSLARLRAAAAFDLVWEEPESELVDIFEDAPDESMATDAEQRALRHIVRNAKYHEELERQIDGLDGVLVVRFRFPRLSLDSCAACRSASGKTYQLDDLPEFPLEGCVSEQGCKFDVDVEEQEPEDEQENNEGLEHQSGGAAGVTQTIATRLSRLKDLFDDDLITKEEYERKKAEILSEL